MDNEESSDEGLEKKSAETTTKIVAEAVGESPVKVAMTIYPPVTCGI